MQVIDNVEDNHMEEVKALNFPGRSEEGYMVPFTKVCYIEATDFREADSKDYYGLAPGKSVMLRCVPAAPCFCPLPVVALWNVWWELCLDTVLCAMSFRKMLYAIFWLWRRRLSTKPKP